MLPTQLYCQQGEGGLVCNCGALSVLQRESLVKKVVSLACRRVLHIPIGFAPLPIIHNFEGTLLKSALHVCPMPSTQGMITHMDPDINRTISSSAGIADKELRLDAHALAGLYSCKILSFDGYIQSLNPNLTCAIRPARLLHALSAFDGMDGSTGLSETTSQGLCM